MSVITDKPPDQEGGEGGFGGVEFTDKPIVEAGEFSFTNKKESLVICGKLRNGLSIPVKKAMVVVNLLGKKGKLLKSGTVQAGDVVQPGQIVPFTITIEKPPAFTSFEYNLTYKEVK